MSASSSIPVPAELPARFAARAIDVLVLVAIDVGLGLVIGFGFDWLAIGTAVVLGYFVLLDALAGATLGKLALGLRVTGPDGGKPSVRQALIREAFSVVGAVPFVAIPRINASVALLKSSVVLRSSIAITASLPMVRVFAALPGCV